MRLWSTNTNGQVVVDGSVSSRPGDVNRLKYIWSKFQSEIKKAASDTGVPESWLLAFIKAESNGVVLAKGAAGEAGLMQLMPDLWQGRTFEQAAEPSFNIGAGARLLRSRLPCHKWDLPSAASSYNCGCNLPKGMPWPTSKHGSIEWGMCAASEGYIGNVTAHSNDAIGFGVSGSRADVMPPTMPGSPATPMQGAHRADGGGVLVVASVAAIAGLGYFWYKG